MQGGRSGRERKLDEVYRRVLEAGRRSCDVIAEPEGAERRRHPRLRVKPGALPAELDPWVFAIDISIAGMAFYADEPVAKGETVTIHLGELAQADVEVLGCQEERPDGRYLRTRYRLHWRFTDEEEGKRLLVTIQDLEGSARPS
jgi:PilZ domain